MKNLAALFLAIVLTMAGISSAVTSNVTRHKGAEQLLKGKSKDVVVSSEGKISLGLKADVLKDEFKDVWSINSIVVSGESVFVGTSPNGGIYEYKGGKFNEVYKAASAADANDGKCVITQVKDANQTKCKGGEVKDANQTRAKKVSDSNEAAKPVRLANEHIFAMAKDGQGRVLAGISGEKCRLVRIEGGKVQTVFEPNNCKYIFSIAVAANGNIYLGTGPEGKVFKLDSTGKNAEEIYDSSDKNIMSLEIGDDGNIYAGSDSRGLVYRIDAKSKAVSVVYDSEQDEIVSLIKGKDGDIFAAGTSANVVNTQISFASKTEGAAGRPEVKSEGKNGRTEKDGGIKLNIANTKEEKKPEGPEPKIPSMKGRPGEKKSIVYRINKEGFVTDIFSQSAMFFAMSPNSSELLVGSGNDAKLFRIDMASEEAGIVYQDDKAAQLTAVTADGNTIYIGTANPAKLVKLSGALANEGSYESALIDAGQPAAWGKLQIEADIPEGSDVLVSSRSGNVGDANDATFSKWSAAVSVKGPVQLTCPAGRFCQYKLILKAGKERKSPVIREVAAAHTIPNLAPKVESVTADRISGQPGKEGFFKIDYKASDRNNDMLIYRIDFRRVGRDQWIKLKEKIDRPFFEWDTKSVEDGRYELKVTASDERSNTEVTKLSDSRISDVVIVDNSPPVVDNWTLDAANGKVTLKFTAVDQLSTIGELAYTADSNDDWVGSLPDDRVFDTMSENFTVLIKPLVKGEHVITLRIKDAVDNVAYKSFDIYMKD